MTSSNKAQPSSENQALPTTTTPNYFTSLGAYLPMLTWFGFLTIQMIWGAA